MAALEAVGFVAWPSPRCGISAWRRRVACLLQDGSIGERSVIAQDDPLSSLMRSAATKSG
jgi:hypothetical protein